MQQPKKEQKPILIYFKTRGNAQIIRCVLLEIGISYQQIFLSWTGYLDQSIIKKYKLDLTLLPYLIHNQFVIHGVFPIIKYICSTFNRKDLLGITFRDSIHIAQVMVKHTRERSIILNTLFNGLKQIYEKNLGQQGKITLCKKILSRPQYKKNIDPIRQMFKNTGQFLFGYLTIVDFIFYDKCFYGYNFHLNTQFITQCPQYQITCKYKEFFQSTPFFKKYGQKLSQYKVFFPQIDANIYNLVKSMWIGDPKYVTCD